jgi:mono/diheme cytochrome c family protein
MSRSGRFRGSPAFIAAAAMATAVFLLGAPASVAQEDVAEGKQISTDRAGCQQCHGWAGDGLASGFHSPGGLPLRKTQLTRDQIRMTIQCGRPGTEMPHFDAFAYTDKRCYGTTAKDLGDKVPERAEHPLQPYQIDAVADYVAIKLKGAGPVTREECLAFFGQDAQIECANYPQAANALSRKQ